LFRIYVFLQQVENKTGFILSLKKLFPNLIFLKKLNSKNQKVEIHFFI